jgi:hypothetical protein
MDPNLFIDVCGRENTRDNDNNESSQTFHCRVPQNCRSLADRPKDLSSNLERLSKAKQLAEKDDS